MANVFVKPAPGRSPRHETTHRPLDPAGEFWEDDAYLRRRLRDGDIVLARFVDPMVERAAAAALSGPVPAEQSSALPAALPAAADQGEPANAALPAADEPQQAGQTQSEQFASAAKPAKKSKAAKKGAPE